MKAAVVPTSFKTPPIIRSPPYHTKTSQAERSLSAASQLSAWVTNNTETPASATNGAENHETQDEAIQQATTLTNTTKTIASLPRIGPSFFSSREA